jgi:hypothetical protein
MDELQLDIICTYKMMTEDGEDEIGLKQMLYQLQLLQILNMSDYDDITINKKINHLYTELKEYNFINKLLKENPHSDQLTDQELIFRTLFSYDYLDLFHKCLYNHSINESMDYPVSCLLKEFKI